MTLATLMRNGYARMEGRSAVDQNTGRVTS